MVAGPFIRYSSSLGQHPSAFLPFGQIARSHLARRDVADDARGHEAGNFRRVVGRRTLDDFHSRQRLRVGDDLEKLQHFTPQKATLLVIRERESFL